MRRRRRRSGRQLPPGAGRGEALRGRALSGGAPDPRRPVHPPPRGAVHEPSRRCSVEGRPDTRAGRVVGQADVDGQHGPTTDGKYDIIVGAMGTEKITVVVDPTTKTALGLAGDITSSTNAATAITNIDQALSTINAARAKLGASINQLTYAADNLTNVVQNTTASRSQILDTDYATATTKLASSQIISQAATAMLAQANQSQQSVLALLK
mgnify:CR=1 FL=1